MGVAPYPEPDSYRKPIVMQGRVPQYAGRCLADGCYTEQHPGLRPAFCIHNDVGERRRRAGLADYGYVCSRRVPCSLSYV